MAQKTAVEIVNSLGITMSYREVAENPLLEIAWKEPAQHYQCTLRFRRRKFEVYCSMADEDLYRLPTAPLMISLIMDELSLIESIPDQDEFVEMYNPDGSLDPGVPERVHERLGEIARKFRKFLTIKVYDELTRWALAARERSMQ